MLYNIVLVSAIEQSGSVTCVHRTSLPQISFPFSSAQGTTPLKQRTALDKSYDPNPHIIHKSLTSPRHSLQGTDALPPVHPSDLSFFHPPWLPPPQHVSCPSKQNLITLFVEKGLLQGTLLNDVDDLTCKAEIETWTQRRNIWITTGKKGSGKNWETRIDIYSLLILRIRQLM